jgi:hypothetical protein
MNWVSKSAWLAGAAALAIAATGCGMEGAPLPPSLNLPAPVSDLAAVRTGNRVSLTWTMPSKNTDKLLLKGKVDVRVCRKEGDQQPCVAAGHLDLAPDSAGAFSEELPKELAAGAPRELAYFVELRNRNGRSAGLSNGAVVLAGAAPAAVDGLEATLRKDGVVLRWNVAPEMTAVRLQRKLVTPPAAKAAQGPLAPQPEPVEQNLLVEAGQNASGTIDKNIRFGQTYEYRAQRVARVSVSGKAMELDGPLSAPVRIEAKDVFPPTAPTGLAAVAVAGEAGAQGVDLSWQPNTEANLAGYAVYRRVAQGAWQRISPQEPVVGPGFHDGQVEAGRLYEYAVTAVGQNGHESGRSDSVQETVPTP